jgi:two-component system cell cycle response regulator DivK
MIPERHFAAEEPSSMQTDRIRKTVLVVEDNELNLKLVYDVLEYHGYTVVTTRLGTAVLELAREHKPALILMDIQLPDISGLDATGHLKSHDDTRTIPVIAVTAFGMPGDEGKILAAGCDVYLRKPFSVAELLDLVERYAGGSGTG